MAALEGFRPLEVVVETCSFWPWIHDTLEPTRVDFHLAHAFGFTRWKGAAVVDAACGLTSNPKACVLHVAQRVRRVGPILIFGAKFLPGVGNLIAPASALAGVGAKNFLLRDLLAGALSEVE